ncbi:MAG: BaiN/RdsA family NAD(P)/FAD-dependent oxidoreductase [Anaerolineae bacterium]
MNQRVIVVGGGASGLMAAGRAAESGAQVILVEKGNRIGRKLLLTGNGRCNLTNLAPPRDFISRLGPNGAFMRNSLARCDAQTIRAFFRQQGVATHADEQGRVYPVSDKSSDVAKALHNYCLNNNVRIITGARVIRLSQEAGHITGIVTNQFALPGEVVILATGGKSWPKTGSEGDGYQLLSQVGHTTSPLYPGLVPLVAADSSLSALEGLSLSQVGIEARRDGKRITQLDGDILFTSDGLSGPAILNLSNTLSSLLWNESIELLIDFIPQLSFSGLDTQLAEAGSSEMSLASYLKSLFPRRLVVYLLGKFIESPIPAASRGKSEQLSAKQRSLLVELLKRFPVVIKGTRPFGEAMVTLGGVRCSEVNPVTFESRLINGLYITGELLDIAGESGGYNLQCAFTSGWLAGLHAAGASA